VDIFVSNAQNITGIEGIIKLYYIS